MVRQISIRARKRLRIDRNDDQVGVVKRVELAKRMDTSRASPNRLLDPDNGAITLSTLQKTASVLGRRIRLQLI